MSGTTVMIKEIGNQIDPNKKKFEIDSSGRTYGLKVDYPNGEYDLYVYYQNKFFKTKFKYESIILKYFYSNNLNRLVYVDTINMVSSDNSYIDTSNNNLVDSDEALDKDGNIKDGYITEAQHHESTLGSSIASMETEAIKRKFNIE